MDDFVSSYAERGNENYIRLKKIVMANKGSFNRILRLVHQDSKEARSRLYAGTLAFTEEDAAKVEEIYGKCRDLQEALCYTRKPNDAFYAAASAMFETDNYNHDRMVKNCILCRGTYAQMSSTIDQLKEFSRIYNYRRQKDTIFFEDRFRNRGRNVRDYISENFRPNFAGEDASTLRRE